MERASYGKCGPYTLIFLAAALPAFAQTSTTGPVTSSTADSGGSAGLEEIVVTARRRAEGIEHVPAAITALTSDALTEQDIHTEQDLQLAVPGLIIRTGNDANQLNYVIRGESIDNYSGSVPGVQPYVNEAPISTNSATSFYDIQSIQVLKGPQGTLFGRNTTGGAVLYQTTQPTNEFGGYGSIQYGNLARVIGEGALNLPIVPDKVLLRIAGTDTSGGAYMRNLYDGSMLGDLRERSARVTLLLKPTDALSNLTTLEYSSFGGTNPEPVPYYIVPCGQQGGASTCAFEPSNPAFEALLHSPAGSVFPGYPKGYVYPGGMASLIPFLQQAGSHVADGNAPNTHTGENQLAINTTTFEIAPAATLKNTFGYNRTYSGNLYDTEGTPYPLLQGGVGFNVPGGNDMEVFETKGLSDELQLQGKVIDGRLNYIVGLFYDDEKGEFNSPITGMGFAEVTPGVPSSYVPYTYAVRYHTFTEDKSYAGFAQGTFAITDRLNLTGGVRGTWSELSSVQGAGSVYGEGNSQRASENKPSWTVTLDYSLSPQLMTYLTTRGSWRVGGYAPAGAPVGNTTTAADGGNYFLPETVKDVEAGIKFNGHLGGMPLQVNADIYNSWVDQVQKVAEFLIDGNIASATVNAQAAEITGVEGDIQVRPAPWLRLGANISYTNARFTEPQVSLDGVPTTFGPYGDAPRFAGSIYEQVTATLGHDIGALTFRTDLFAQSPFYFSNLNNTLEPGTEVPGYAVVNMRLDWADLLGAQGLTASLFAKNLANKLYYTGGNPGAQDESVEAVNVAPPRTYGLILRYSF